MPRAESGYQTAAAASAIETAWLVRVPSLPLKSDPSSTIELCFTDYQENIVLGGKTYYASPMTITPPKISRDMSQSSGSVALSNITAVFSSYARTYQIQDAQIIITHAVKSGSGWVTAVAFVGVMDAPHLTEEQFSVSIVNGRSVTSMVPRVLYTIQRFPHLPSSKDPREISLK